MADVDVEVAEVDLESRMVNPVIHVALFTATTFVNKYVLSTLRFTYPTIFQGWQTLVGALLLRLLIEFGKVKVDLHSITRAKLLPWLPAMFIYILSIYSGSVALSKMAIPHFVCFQNCVHVFSAAVEFLPRKKVSLTVKHLPHAIILLTSILLYTSDSQHDVKTYLWMLVHVTSVGAIVLYEHFRRDVIQLSDLEKIYLNYVFSFLMLAPFSYFLGDAISAQSFKFWYYYRFYIGCVLSGVFGAFLSLTAIKVKESGHEPVFYNLNLDISATSRCTSALLSVIFFSFPVTPSVLIMVTLNISASLFVNGFKDQKQKPGDEKLLAI